MIETGTGIFPNGPAQQMARDREEVIRALVLALMSIRRTLWSELARDREERFWKKVRERVDHARTGCIICGAENTTCRDLDSLFCSRHCMVCWGWDAVLEKAGV